MDGQRPKVRIKRLAVAAAVAVVIHLQLLLTGLLPGMYRYWSELFPRPEPADETEVRLVSLTPRQFEQNRQAPTMRAEVEREEPEPQPEPEPEAEAEPEQEEMPEGQVVDVAPTADDSPPEEAEFLSEHNTNVERQTVSRDQRHDYQVAQPKPTQADAEPRAEQQRQDRPGENEVALVTRKRGQREEASQQGRAFEVPDIQQREALDLKLDLDFGELARMRASDALRGNAERLRIQPGAAEDGEEAEAGEAGEHDTSVAMLPRPIMEEKDLVSGAPANDHIEDVPKGEATLLNSREFKYATFFNRVKRGVSQHWGPRVGEEYRRRDPYGNIYGVEDRRTLVSVALDPKGELVGVDVVRSSGVQFFDQVAVESFRKASPFPNPPRGLVESDGKINFQFGFYFIIGERPGLRAFRFERRPF